MRKLLPIIAAVFALLLSACHDDYDDIFTNADIVVSGGDTLDIHEIRATVTMTNLNTRQETKSTNFTGAPCHVDEMLKGSYNVVVEGVARFTDPAKGRDYTRLIRCQSEYLPFYGETNSDTVQIVFMDVVSDD